MSRIRKGTETRRFIHTGHDRDALAVLADGRLASGSHDEDAIRLWNPASGVCEATLQGQGHTDTVYALALLADGQIAQEWQDRTIRVWQVPNGRWTGAVGL